MINIAGTLTNTIDVAIKGFAEVRTDVITDNRSLFSKRSFKVNDVISDFYFANVFNKPTRLTIQTGEDEHIELLPAYLECINHSCEPNAFFDTTHKKLVCIRSIKKNEEFTFFYPSAEWNMDAPFNCYCKSKHCVGYIAGAKYLTKKQQSRYRFTDFIQQKLAEKKTITFIENKDLYKVWVLAPFLETTDTTLQSYYDYSQSIAEYKKVFAEIDCDWEWVNITRENLDTEVKRIKSHCLKNNIVLNLCDGDELNGIPGISVIYALEKNGITYTGADAYFYDITTSKINMKKAFDRDEVCTPGWALLNGTINKNFFKELGETAFVKPAVSAGSMGISIKNVVSNFQELENVVADIRMGYHGWKLDSDGLIAEQFINGREFTTFLVGSSTAPEHIKFYQPAERIFHSSLPEKEKFLSFDRLWATHHEESEMPDDEFFYVYAPVESPELIEALRSLSLLAYQSVKGMGYARLDFRMDKDTQCLYVLEVNSQCGLSEDEDYTSIGAILRFSNKTFTDIIIEILDDALFREKNLLK